MKTAQHTFMLYSGMKAFRNAGQGFYNVEKEEWVGFKEATVLRKEEMIAWALTHRIEGEKEHSGIWFPLPQLVIVAAEYLPKEPDRL